MSQETMPDQTMPAKESVWSRIRNHDLTYQFLRSPVTVTAAVICLVLIVSAMCAPWLATMNRFVFGTDDQGRDLYSAILYGLRVSLAIGAGGVALAAAIGITLGLVAGYFGGRIDAVIMRIADVQLTFPAILIALLVNGVVQALAKGSSRETWAFGVLILSIGLSFWVQYARTIRGSTLIEKNKDYIHAAKLVGQPTVLIMLRHLLPNVIGPTLVILTINMGLAIITEATLSFLGVGLPPTQPSLGTLISIGNKYLFSGDWWIVTFPGVTLAVFVLSINLIGDWLRDALNPRLQ